MAHDDDQSDYCSIIHVLYHESFHIYPHTSHPTPIHSMLTTASSSDKEVGVCATFDAQNRLVRCLTSCDINDTMRRLVNEQRLWPQETGFAFGFAMALKKPDAMRQMSEFKQSLRAAFKSLAANPNHDFRTTQFPVETIYDTLCPLRKSRQY